MSSRRIAELTGKKHSNVLRDIRNMLQVLGIEKSTYSCTYLGGNGSNWAMYLLPYNETICLLTGYNMDMKMAVINALQQVNKSNKPACIETYIKELEKLIKIKKYYKYIYLKL
jgi:phage regulator Rha-like protein